jgi:ATP-binding cassette, subfamily A (ABC1), member 1
MITGDLSITSGDIFINDYSVRKQVESVHKSIGYCPQVDSIMPLLSAREQLIFYARLRGIPEKYVGKAAIWAINRVGLNVFADRICGDFSGGNKRKLSTAIALIGDPTVICLDEPTSGMDAKARRLLWNDIISLIKEDRIVILTSHSMDECEALCTRMVIMVNGEFKCLGSPQELKRKFGNGYKLSVRLNDLTKKDEFIEFMNREFPTLTEQEIHKNLFEFVLPFSSSKLSHIFGKIERNRSKFDINDYSVNQTTLDQIFVNFAKKQVNGNETNVIEQEEIINQNQLPIINQAFLIEENKAKINDTTKHLERNQNNNKSTTQDDHDNLTINSENDSKTDSGNVDVWSPWTKDGDDNSNSNDDEIRTKI